MLLSFSPGYPKVGPSYPRHQGRAAATVQAHFRSERPERWDAADPTQKLSREEKQMLLLLNELESEQPGLPVKPWTLLERFCLKSALSAFENKLPIESSANLSIGIRFAKLQRNYLLHGFTLIDPLKQGDWVSQSGSEERTAPLRSTPLAQAYIDALRQDQTKHNALQVLSLAKQIQSKQIPKLGGAPPQARLRRFGHQPPCRDSKLGSL